MLDGLRPRAGLFSVKRLGEKERKKTICIDKPDCGNNGSLGADAEARAGENQTLGLCDLAER